MTTPTTVAVPRDLAAAPAAVRLLFVDNIRTTLITLLDPDHRAAHLDAAGRPLALGAA